MTLKIDGWHWKTPGHLIHNVKLCASFQIHGCIKLQLQSGNAKSVSKLAIFVPCDLEIWWMTLKSNGAPILYYIKLCAVFQGHWYIQTGVTVRKRLSWVLTSVTLTFDLWPWPFAWTSLWSLIITPDNFMVIRWWEHSEKGVTDGETERRTENTIHRAAWSQLKCPCEGRQVYGLMWWTYCLSNDPITREIWKT